MADQFLGEIRVFPFDFAPSGWAQCNGQVIGIMQNTALFSLLGTYYGGDGMSNFALPNLQGAIPIHQGGGPGLTSRNMGDAGGSPTVTLAASQIPKHTHPVMCAATANASGPTNAVFATNAAANPAAYGPTGSSMVKMNPSAVSTAGGGQPHPNMPPFVTLNFCIALLGAFPPRA